MISEEAKHRNFFLRTIQLEFSDNEVVGELEDDFHHIRIRLQHDGSQVTAITGEAVRVPWSSCPSAADQLEALINTPLTSNMNDILSTTDRKMQCTHMLELAAIAIAQISQGKQSIDYRIEVPDKVDNRTRAALIRDGQEILAWEIEGDIITKPASYNNLNLRHLRHWAEKYLDDSSTTEALILRRVAHISRGRNTATHKTSLHDSPHLVGACFTFSQPDYSQVVRMDILEK